MKLEYIKLENFALLRAGMNLSEIELDFRNAPNGINLIIGNNGTGKTGLLSNLHPFATLGHLEARDDQDLIIPGKDGRKFAIFSTKKHTYEIEHFYKWQGENNSRQIRSYFRKDGE
jgi:recombinational DNA repair ATPase RecF